MRNMKYGQEAFCLALDLLGGVSATAKILHRTVSAVSNITSGNGRGIPRSWCKALEKATKGRVTAHQLRPDIKWK